MKKDTAGVIMPPPLIYATVWVSGALLHLALPLPVPRGGWIFILGFSLIGMGGVLAVSGFRVMGRAGTNVDPYKSAKALVTDGPFRFTRNPLYLALTLFYAGSALALKLLWPVLFLPAALWIMRRGVIDREERYLEQKFGETYRKYKQRVRRWV